MMRWTLIVTWKKNVSIIAVQLKHLTSLIGFWKKKSFEAGTEQAKFVIAAATNTRAS